MKVITDSRCTEYGRRGHPERPQRISRTIERLRDQSRVRIDWEEPGDVEPELILRAHAAQHVKELNAPFSDFDADTPAYPHIIEHARRSVGGACGALAAARRGEKCFSLLRPPGHHATRIRAMGFCYLNSVAIAALEALQTGAGKVAVFDFDVHHGNGTEAILQERPDCAFFSVHQYPAYPGTGSHSRGNCHNYPVPPGARVSTYRDALSRAFEELLAFQPQLIAVSAGFDAFKNDPLSDEPLDVEDFAWLGQQIRQSGIPAFCILEGGYSIELPDLILAFLEGWEG